MNLDFCYLTVFENFAHYPASFSIHFGISSHCLCKYWTTFLKYWSKSSKASLNSPCLTFWVFKLRVDLDKLAPFPLLSWGLSVSPVKTRILQNHLLLLEIPADGDRSENEILLEFCHNYKLHERAQTQRHKTFEFSCTFQNAWLLFLSWTSSICKLKYSNINAICKNLNGSLWKVAPLTWWVSNYSKM